MQRHAAHLAIGTLLLLELLVGALFVSADASGVSAFGKRWTSECSLKRYAGVPCPTCGMTRSVILTLHGDLGTAVRLNPAGPLWVLAVLTAGAALLCARRWVRPLAIVQGSAFGFVLTVHWVGALIAR